MMGNHVKKSILLAVLVVSFTLLLTYCNNENNPTGGNTPADISGIWIADEIEISNCDTTGNPKYETELFEVEQNNNTVTFRVVGETSTITGSISGNTVSWTTTENDGNEVTETTFSGTISGDKKTLNGTATWTWTDNSSGHTCGGTTTVHARKAEAPTFSIAGRWEGDYTSAGGYIHGSFEANLIQDNALLTGTIDVFGYTQNLKGVVTQNEIIFGDIDDEILFSGNFATSIDSAYGTYMAYGNADSGSWTASRTIDSSLYQFTILDSLSLPIFSTGDITFDGTYFWAVSENEKIYKISLAGQLVDSIDTPGDYTEGLAFNGTHLVTGDGAWGMNTIFKMQPEGSSAIYYPYLGGSLTFDGSNLWAIKDGNISTKAYKLNNRGQILDSLSSPGDMCQGLAHDGTNFYFAVWQEGSVEINKMNASGTLIDTYPIDDFLPGGLTYGGGYLWYVLDSDSIAKIDGSGNIVATFAAPGNGFGSAGDLAFDGNNLWHVRAEVDDYRIYQMDLSGNVISTIYWPGQGTSEAGLTFDGTNLRLSDYNTERIYSVNPNGNNYFDYPNSNSLDYLTTDGTTLWSLDNLNSIVTEFDYSGTQSDLFSINLSYAKGIANNGSNLFIANGIQSFDNLTEFDVDGNEIAQYLPLKKHKEPNGLVFDGTNFWYMHTNYMDDNSTLYKIGLSQ